MKGTIADWNVAAPAAAIFLALTGCEKPEPPWKVAIREGTVVPIADETKPDVTSTGRRAAKDGAAPVPSAESFQIPPAPSATKTQRPVLDLKKPDKAPDAAPPTSRSAPKG